MNRETLETSSPPNKKDKVPVKSYTLFKKENQVLFDDKKVHLLTHASIKKTPQTTEKVFVKQSMAKLETSCQGKPRVYKQLDILVGTLLKRWLVDHVEGFPDALRWCDSRFKY